MLSDWVLYLVYTRCLNLFKINPSLTSRADSYQNCQPIQKFTHPEKWKPDFLFCIQDTRETLRLTGPVDMLNHSLNFTIFLISIFKLHISEENNVLCMFFSTWILFCFILFFRAPLYGRPLVISLSIHLSFRSSILLSICPSKISCLKYIFSPLGQIWLILHTECF